MNFPYAYFPVRFTKDGTLFQRSDLDALMSGITAEETAIGDLLIMCHGWNNDIDDATALYSGLANLTRVQIDSNSALSGRKYAICGALWPSKKFEEDDLIPGGAVPLNDIVTIDQLKQRLQDFRSLYAGSEWPFTAAPAPADFDEMESLMDNIENDEAARKQVVNVLRGLLPRDAASNEDASKRFFESSATTLIENLRRQLTHPRIPAGGGAASLDPFSGEIISGLSGAAGFSDVPGGIRSGFLHLLNYTTYYLMKARAGDVGVKGVAPLLVQLRGKREGLRIHMIGHSFGCRLVAAAINALPGDERFRPDTVTLLQGAFSHNGFAMQGDTDRGAFRDVIEKKKVRGPVLITHTRNDKAVGIAYPIASRINGVTAAALGDANDVFGGLGSNGTQTKDTTPEGVPGTLLEVTGTYPFAGGCSPATPFNLNADEFIKGHSDIQKAEVAFALTVAMAAGQPETLRSVPPI